MASVVNAAAAYIDASGGPGGAAGNAGFGKQVIAASSTAIAASTAKSQLVSSSGDVDLLFNPFAAASTPFIAPNPGSNLSILGGRARSACCRWRCCGRRPI